MNENSVVRGRLVHVAVLEDVFGLQRKVGALRSRRKKNSIVFSCRAASSRLAGSFFGGVRDRAKPVCVRGNRSMKALPDRQYGGS